MRTGWMKPEHWRLKISEHWRFLPEHFIPLVRRKRLDVLGVLKVPSGERGYVVVVAQFNNQVPLMMFNNWVFKRHQFLFLFWPTFGQANKNSHGIKEHEIEADIPDLIHWNYCLAYVSQSQNMHYSQISSKAPGYSDPRSNKIKVLRSEGDTCTPMLLAALFIIARTWKQPRCPSADKWKRKLWYIYTMEYYSAIKKNSFESVLMRWMQLEPIIQSEVSQKDKDHYSILTHIYGI